MRSKLAMVESLLIVMVALASGAQAGCSCSAGADAWSGQAWLEDTMDESSEGAAPSTGTEAGAGVEEEIGAEVAHEDETDLDEEIFSTSLTAQELQERLEGDSQPVIAYVSNTPIQGSYIEGSIALPSKSLIQADGSLKTIADLAGVLGKAGISEEDDLVIYGDCFSCGDATFLYWAMKYLGHQNVAVLRGSQQDWSAAGISLSGATSAIAEAVYIPDPRPELLADYESVASGNFAVVDVRAPDQFGAGHIDGAINIDYNRVIEGSWLKDDSALTEIFSDLEKDRTVAVYTKNGGQASIVWYALMLQGYDARLYTWNDWLGHQS